MTEHLDLNMPLMRHCDGIPIIMRALSTSEIHAPVQVIANLDLKQLVDISSVARDPLWREVLAGVDGPGSEGAADAVVIDTAADVEHVLLDALREVLELDQRELGKPSRAPSIQHVLTASDRSNVNAGRLWS